MNTAQKVIKYLALALAISITIGIVGGGLKLIGSLTVLEQLLPEKVEYESKSISASVNELDIDVSNVDLTILPGEDFSVTMENAAVSCKEWGNRLVIAEQGLRWLKNQGGSVVLYVPEGYQWEKVEIDTGAGEARLNRLQAKTLELNLGAGKVTLGDLNITQKAEIDGGVGALTFSQGYFANLDLDLGIGELELTAHLSGKNEINCGIGKVNLTLIDSDAYRIHLDKGVGEATYRGEPMKNGTVYGSGETYVEINGGIGSISVDLAELGIED